MVFIIPCVRSKYNSKPKLRDIKQALIIINRKTDYTNTHTHRMKTKNRSKMN